MSYFGNTAAVPVGTTGSAAVSVQIHTRPCVYKGFGLRELVGAAAVVRVYDSANSTLTGKVLLDTIRLNANESAREYYNDGIMAGSGIYFEVVSGDVEGSLRVVGR